MCKQRANIPRTAAANNSRANSLQTRLGNWLLRTTVCPVARRVREAVATLTMRKATVCRAARRRPCEA